VRSRGHLLLGEDRRHAIDLVCAGHYSHCVPSGKSYYVGYENAIVVWSILANKNLAKFILPEGGIVWELSRLWAPDNHRANLLTEAISAAVGVLRQHEKPDALVSYADPNVGHEGGVYRAASWLFHGRSEESRVYTDGTGQSVSRRAFHSGSKGLTKAEIEARGYVQSKLPGKLRFVRPLTAKARHLLN
jgi:hypothetical protein